MSPAQFPPAEDDAARVVKSAAADPEELHADVEKQSHRDIFNTLFFVRLATALSVHTFFQPDEYYQALEPAWQLAFGPDSGAWMTWEWQYQLRSPLHPFLIAGCYKIVHLITKIGLPPALASQLLVAAPKIFGAAVCAAMEYHTWKLARRLFGWNNPATTASVAMLVLNPFQFFAGTRSLANVLEASLTIAALSYWPWDVLKHSPEHRSRKNTMSTYKYAVVLGGLAFILRPTNIIIWVVMVLFTLPQLTQDEFHYFVRDSSIMGLMTLGAARVVDRLYYKSWTFPPLNFWEFNMRQNIAIFYGQNRPDYYITEGLPILLTTALPFGIIGVVKSLRRSNAAPATPRIKPRRSSVVDTSPQLDSTRTCLQALATVIALMVAALSLISHKEVRFLYPLLPIFSIVSAPVLTHFAHPFPRPGTFWGRLSLALTLAVNIPLAFYTGLMHQRGAIDVVDHLRSRFETLNTDFNGQLIKTGNPLPFLESVWVPGEGADVTKPISVAFLMPCHSTPWRSHLVYSDINAWALTCEPPLNMNTLERDAYVDEADVFYKDPNAWIEANMAAGGPAGEEDRKAMNADGIADIKSKDGKKAWPMFIAGFDQLYEAQNVVRSFERRGYTECFRTYNSHIHDDWRRTGDIILWCAPGVDNLTISPAERYEAISNESPKMAKKGEL